ncbi:hypothetical protein N0V93_007249 [Gnomoniopsis smithogilvyi]|uniref:F-box domain-containing protein n=1 Tax=Gnomoniopsis smithogilvyi TaxID=1191159 RepID=A0A9W8YR78_9PEZI|nr:hypothetical protein N0V93_007249 [Gnomoniopsis smithogilvyi]
MASQTPVEGLETPKWAPRRLRFTDLPGELQKDIIRHCPQSDLICLSLANKHFRELATAELYRTFHIVFPDDDDPAYESPVDGLANGLETFATSDYDHAKHLREITLDTVSAGDKAELAYKPYLANNSCGKFMNVLFLLVLRKAKYLETLNWNIRVELSRPVYKALHEISTIQHLHLRLQAGPSLYEVPPPLPLYSPSASTSPGASTHSLPLFNHPVHHTNLNFPPYFIPPPTSSLPPPPPPPKPSRTRSSRKSATSKSPPTLSGFKNLKSLSVLDIDDLEVVTELKSCIRNSQGTLNKLKLSFSSSLAMRARKPPPDIDPDDSDPDDEFQVVPVSVPTPLPSYDDISGPARIFRAQEERKTQEAVLGRIFDVEPYLVKRPARRTKEKEDEAPKQEQTAAPASDFINSLKAVSGKLMKELNGSDDFTAAQQEILDTIEAAARKYVSEEATKTEGSQKPDGNSESSTTKVNYADTNVAVASDDQQAESSLFEDQAHKSKETEQGSSPDDIDVEAPVEDSFTEDVTEVEAVNASDDASPAEASLVAAEPAKTATGENATAENDNAAKADSNPSVSKAGVNLEAQRANFKTLGEKLRFYEIEAGQLQKEINSMDVKAGPDVMKQFNEAERQIASFSDNIKDIKHEMAIVAAELEDAERQKPNGADIGGADVRQRISEYTRSTRGLSLHTLSIHLIPVKASVLSRAVDLRCLKKLTLLNVGNQAPIWALLAKENKAQPLPLRHIFTDNVSVVFLTLVSQLSELNELYMLERSEKYKPEAFAPKSTVTIDQIRRFALRKHQNSLKRLMIKNQNDMTWDLDTKTTLLLTRFKVLEELAISMSIREIHTLLQQIHLMANLRALHIVNLRNDDTCVWVMRETKRFIIDNLSHFPELKLEWLAIDEDEHAERLIRWKAPPRDKKKKAKAKGKEKATSSTPTNGDQYPVLSLEPGVDSDSDDDDIGGGLKIETIDNIHFYDVWDVGIFKRNVVSGRL